MSDARERVEEAFDDIGIGGIYDVFDPDDPADAIRQLGHYIREAEEVLPGGFMPGEDSPYFGMSLADRIRSALRDSEGREVVGRGWIKNIEKNGDCRSWLVDEVGWRKAPEHLQVALIRRQEAESDTDTGGEDE